MKNKLLAILFVIVGLIVGMEIVGKITKKLVFEINNNIEKFKMYYGVLNQWLMLKQQNLNISDYFEVNNYKEIAIYGMDEMGKRLFNELKDKNIHIKYAIDEEYKQTGTKIKVMNLKELKKQENYRKIDVVVVTTMYVFDEIKCELASLFECPIISLEDVIYNVYN